MSDLQQRAQAILDANRYLSSYGMPALSDEVYAVIRDLLAENERLRRQSPEPERPQDFASRAWLEKMADAEDSVRSIGVGGLASSVGLPVKTQPFRDDEPVTPEMVERLGWCKQKWGRDASCVSFVSPLASDGRTTLRWRSSFGHQGWRIASSGVADSYAITPVTTFGQLAALCRGLGIPCEVKDE